MFQFSGQPTNRLKAHSNSLYCFQIINIHSYMLSAEVSENLGVACSPDLRAVEGTEVAIDIGAGEDAVFTFVDVLKS